MNFDVSKENVSLLYGIFKAFAYIPRLIKSTKYIRDVLRWSGIGGIYR